MTDLGLISDGGQGTVQSPEVPSAPPDTAGVVARDSAAISC